MSKKTFAHRARQFIDHIRSLPGRGSLQPETKPHTQDLEYYHTTTDPEANQYTTPSPTVKVRLPSVIVFEVFTPSMIGVLESGATKLGWFDDELSSRPWFPDQVATQRAQARSRAWMHVTHAVPKTNRLFRGITSYAPLPPGVTEIRVALNIPMPSITILICQFMLDDTTAAEVEVPLRDSYSSVIVPFRDGSHMIDGVEHQKERAIRAIRGYISSKCTGWVADYFPGLFTHAVDPTGLPTCEILLFDGLRPYAEAKGPKGYSPMGVLGLRNSFNAWEVDRAQGIFFQWDSSDSEHNRRAVLTAEVTEAAKHTERVPTGAADHFDAFVRWSDALDGSLCTWAVVLTADLFLEQVSRMRDALGDIDVANSRRAYEAVRSLEKVLLRIQRDALPFARDLRVLCRDKRLYSFGHVPFTPVADFRKGSGDLLDSYRSLLATYAEDLQSRTILADRVATRTASALSAAANDRLARSNFRLQWAMALMTVAILILTAYLTYLQVTE